MLAQWYSEWSIKKEGPWGEYIGPGLFVLMLGTLAVPALLVTGVRHPHRLRGARPFLPMLLYLGLFLFFETSRSLVWVASVCGLGFVAGASWMAWWRRNRLVPARGPPP